MNIEEKCKSFIQEHIEDDVHTLALEAAKYPELNMRFIVRQIAGRQSVKNKLPRWYADPDIIFPEHLPLEQSSSELAAAFKAKLLKGNTFVDLTGGLGVDFSYISPNFSKAVYVERQEELCKLATHNFNVLGLKNTVIANIDAQEYLNTLTGCDCIFIDPARRGAGGGKTVFLEDCEPDVLLLKDKLLAKADKIVLKLSPMLDIARLLNSLPEIYDLYVISVQNECKELLAVMSKAPKQDKDIQITCVDIGKDKEERIFSFSRSQEAESICSYATSLEKYLYEPSVTLLKAGAYRITASVFELKKLHMNSHLYTSDKLVKDFPGRIFEIKAVCSPHKKELSNLLNNTLKANLSIRNFPSTVDRLKTKLGLKDGGGHYIFATTLADDQKKLIVCGKADCKED